MADDVFKLGADFSDFENAIKALQTTLDKAGQSAAEYMRVWKGLDDQGKALTTWKATTKAGDEFTVTLDAAGKKIGEVTRLNSQLTDSMNTMVARLEAQRIIQNQLTGVQANYLAATLRVDRALADIEPKILGANEAWLAQTSIISEAGKALAQYYRNQQVFEKAAQIGADAAFASQKIRFNLLRQQAQAAPRGPGMPLEDQYFQDLMKMHGSGFNGERGAALVEAQTAAVERAHAAALAEEATYSARKAALAKKRIDQDLKDFDQAARMLEAKTEKERLMLVEAANLNQKFDYNRMISQGQYGPDRAGFDAANSGGGSGKPPAGFGAGFGGAFASRFGSQALGTAAGGLIIQGIDMLAGALKRGAEEAVTFDQKISRLSIAENKAVTETTALTHAVLDLSSKFNLDKFDVAQARFKALSQGVVTAADATKYLNQTLGLAQVTGVSAEQATVAVSSAIKAFGLDAKDAQHVSELLFQSWRDGNVDINNLGDNLGRIGSVAAPLGFKLEEIIALFTTFRQRGIEGGEAISTLANWVQRLSAPTPELTMRLKELGFATAEEAVRSGHLAEVLQLLGREASISGENIVKMLGGIRTSRGGLAEIGFFQDAIDSAKKFEQETHQLDTTVKEFTNSSGEHLKKLGTELENVFTRMGKALVDSLDKGAKEVEKAAKKGGWGDKLIDLMNRGVEYFGGGEFAMETPYDKGTSTNKDRAFVKKMQEETAAASLFMAAQTQMGFQKMMEDIDPKNRFKKQVQAEADAALAIKHIYEDKVASQIKSEELLTKKLQDQLAIRLSRFEDSVRLHMDVARKARELGQQAAERIQEINEEYTNNKYGRQMSLLSPDQRNAMLQASVPGSQMQLPFNQDLGTYNLIQDRMKKLQSDREAHMDAVASKTGEAFLSSKDLVEAQKESAEISSVQAEQFNYVAEAYKNHKATIEDVRMVERSITAEKDRQLELQKKLQEAMEKKAADEKAAADLEKERLAQVKDASEKALAMTFDKTKFADPAAMMKQFNDLRNVAMKNVSPAEYAGMAQLFEGKKKELTDSVTRTNLSEGISKGMEDALKSMNATSGKKDLGDHLDEYINKQLQIFKDLEDHIKQAVGGGGVPGAGTGTIYGTKGGRVFGEVKTVSGATSLTDEQRDARDAAAKVVNDAKVSEALAYSTGKLKGPYVPGSDSTQARKQTQDDWMALELKRQESSTVPPQLGGTRKDGSRWDSYVGAERDHPSPGGIRIGMTNALDRLVSSPSMGHMVAGPIIRELRDAVGARNSADADYSRIGGAYRGGSLTDSLIEQHGRTTARLHDPDWLANDVKRQTDAYGPGGSYMRGRGYDFAPQANPKYQPSSQENAGSVKGGTTFNMSVAASDNTPSMQLNPIILGIRQAERKGMIKISDKEVTPGEYARMIASDDTAQ